MARHVTSINGMGASTYSGGVITNTGMQQQDHMHLSQDLFVNGGIVASGDLAVTQNGTPNRSVLIAAGTVYVPNVNYAQNSVTQNAYFRAINDDPTYNIAINTNSSGNPRITSLFAKIDTSATPDGTASNVMTVVAVDGTPAGSPTAPAAPADGNSYFRLADVTCANGFTSITNANIADKRTSILATHLAAPEGFAENVRIVSSVGSNNLTVALYLASGAVAGLTATPTAANPVRVRIGNNYKSISASVNFTLNAGTNWFNLGAAENATQDVDLFVYLIDNSNTGTIVMGISRLPYGRVVGDFSSTSTSDKCLYVPGTAPASTDPVINIGRFNATLSAAASYNWSIPATSIIINRPIFESRILSYQPTYTTNGSMTYGTVTTTTATYQVRMYYTELMFDVTGTTGGSASDGIRISTPITPITPTTPFVTGGYNSDSGYLGGIQPSTSGYVECHKVSGGNYNIGAGKQLAGNVVYRIM